MTGPDDQSTGILVTHIDDIRVRHDARWVKAGVAEIGPTGLKINIRQQIEHDGALQVVLKMKGSVSGTVHLQAEKLQVRRDGRGSQITLRPIRAFAAGGRAVIEEFVTALLSRPKAVDRAVLENERGAYYDFAKELKHETVPITRRSLKHAVRSPSAVVGRAIERSTNRDTPSDGKRGKKAPSAPQPARSGGSQLVATRTETLHGLAVKAPKVLQMPAVDVEIPVAMRAYGTNIRGHIYRVTKDGHRVFVRLPSDVPALWDTVWFYLRVESPTGPRNLHVRATVVHHMDEQVEFQQAFAARLFQVGRADDLQAWRNTIEAAARRNPKKANTRTKLSVKVG